MSPQQTTTPHMQLPTPTLHTKPQLIHRTLQYTPNKSSLTTQHVQHAYKTLIPNTPTHITTKGHKRTNPRNKNNVTTIQPTIHNRLVKLSYKTTYHSIP